jgi:hypothetical protein
MQSNTMSHQSPLKNSQLFGLHRLSNPLLPFDKLEGDEVYPIEPNLTEIKPLLQKLDLDPLARDLLALEAQRYKLALDFKKPKTPKFSSVLPDQQAEHELLTLFKQKPSTLKKIHEICNLTVEQRRAVNTRIEGLKNSDIASSERKRDKLFPSPIFWIHPEMSNFSTTIPMHFSIGYVLGDSKEDPAKLLYMISTIFILQALLRYSRKKAAEHVRLLPHLKILASTHEQQLRRTQSPQGAKGTEPTIRWGLYFWIFAHSIRTILNSKSFLKRRQHLEKTNPRTLQFMTQTAYHLQAYEKTLPPFELGSNSIYRLPIPRPGYFVSPNEVPASLSTYILEKLNSNSYL